MAPPETKPPVDLTAVLLPFGQVSDQDIRRAVEAAGYGDVWLRIRPLEAAALTQLEIFDGEGQPRVDPALVQTLSAAGRAAFVHLNDSAGQALVHAFERGKELEGWVGSPADIDAHVQKALGRTVGEIVAADDGTRVHPFYASSGMMGLTRGRALAVPTGMPIALGSFGFHDRAYAPPGEERVALLAYDEAALHRSWAASPGHALAARVLSAPDHVLGPLAPLRQEVAAELAALGDTSPESGDLRSLRALELLLLTESYAWAGGDEVGYLDERVLPMFSLQAADSPLDDPDEAEELEERASVLEAIVEITPFRSPEGPMLEQIGADELSPLAPWAKPGEEYVGSIFVLEGARLRGLLSGLDQRDLAARLDRFYRAWWKAQTDEPIGSPQYEGWKRGIEEKGAADVNRFLSDWTEWRVALELAAENGLKTALLFYA